MRRFLSMILIVVLVFCLIIVSTADSIIEAEGALNTSSVNLRKEPSKKSVSLGQYNRKQKVYVYDSMTIDGQEWYHVKIKNKEGYILSQFIDVEFSDAVVNEQEAEKHLNESNAIQSETVDKGSDVSEKLEELEEEKVLQLSEKNNNISDLPLNGASWDGIMVSEAVEVLQNAGYTKTDEEVSTDDSPEAAIRYYRDSCPEIVYLSYSRESLGLLHVDFVYYSGSDIVKKIVESYNLIYGDPVVGNNKGSEEFTWKKDGYQYVISFATNYEDAKLGASPFVLTISSTIYANTIESEEASSAESVETEAQELKIGESIDLPFIDMTFSKFEVLNELRFTEKETGGLARSLHKDMDNAKYIAIRGTIKNKGKQAYDVRNGLRGRVYVNDYEYEIAFFSFDFSIEPLVQFPFYLYALVPNELADTFDNCVFRFGFNENFITDHIVYDETIKYDYKYEIMTR